MENFRTLFDAYEFAKRSHEGQERKYTGHPYIEHPVQVAEILYEKSETKPDLDMLIAALLHDVVEDCDVTPWYIWGRFGMRVATMVKDLSDIEEGNRETRKRLTRERLAKASASAQTIKCADIAANTWDIVEHDPKFARVYLKECNDLFHVLEKAELSVWWYARRTLDTAEQELNALEKKQG